MICVPLVARAADWPTYMHDDHRSGVTEEQLQLPLLQAWVYEPPAPPQPAWTGPAKWDAYAGLKNLQSMRNFDPVFFVTTHGDSVFFGSSADDSVHCLDAGSGKEKWSFCTDGPVRVSPTWHEGRLYFGSDDGHAYCLDASDGALVWKHKPSPDGRLIPSNGRLISPWPVRTGVLVRDGKAYFAASLLPWNESYLCAVEAATGSASGPGRFQVALNNVTVQGAMLASQNNLYALQGRSAPLVFQRSDGKSLGPVRGPAGGIYAVLTEEAQLIHGHGSKTGWLALSKDGTVEHLASIGGAIRVVVNGDTAYLQKGTELSALDRPRYTEALGKQKELADQQAAKKKALDKLPKEKVDERKKLQDELKQLAEGISRAQSSLSDCVRWTTECAHVQSLILAGDTLFAGGDGSVAAFSVGDGRQVWEAAVDGQAHGLAAANRRLFVSTDSGAIYCFAAP